jgi:hypothetical protein
VLWVNSYAGMPEEEKFLLFPFAEEQKLKAKNCRMSFTSIWDVLDPPKFMNTESLNATFCANPG